MTSARIPRSSNSTTATTSTRSAIRTAATTRSSRYSPPIISSSPAISCKDAIGIDQELDAQGIDPKKLADGKDADGRGRWLTSLPPGARVKKWFFSHAGNTQRLSTSDLKKKLEKSRADNGFGDKAITGGDSILEAQEAGKKEADALGVSHIVFGHDPGAFGASGKIEQSKNGILVKLDVAMGLHDGNGSGISPGALLHVSTKGHDTAEVLDSHGKASPLGD